MRGLGKFLFRPGVGLVVLIFLSGGCAGRKIEVRKTGFLGSYELLREDPDREGMFIYRNPQVHVQQHYDKVMIAPIQFRLAPTQEQKALSPEDEAKLDDYFREKLIREISHRYKIVDQPGPDVLLLRAAITGIAANKVYLNLHWSTTLVGAGIGGASIEVELVDSLSDEQILAFIDARKGKKYKYHKGLTKWGHTKNVLKEWSKVIVEELESL